jgi:predicted metal-dependent phosphoesterase TrpH
MLDGKDCSKRWLKAELHAHCSVDPVDYRICRYSPEELINQAARRGYDVLAITCHDLDIWSPELSEYASSLGITLIPGMEATVDGSKHVLVYNFRTGCENLNTIEKIRERRREDTLVIAAHPFFPGPTCLHRGLAKNIDVFDAIENSGFQIRGLNFNQRALQIAAKFSKPVVGNGDVHHLWQLNKSFTWIYAEPGILPVIGAIKQGRVRFESHLTSYPQAVSWWASAIWGQIVPANPRPSTAWVPEALADS